MCGINGLVSDAFSMPECKNRVHAMNERLAHRGPDAEGLWQTEGVVLGHRRLSIIDLSEAGTQPMVSLDGRYVIVYNGELYNYKELRFELMRAPMGSEHGPFPFRTNTDTEVVLASFIRYGSGCLQHFNGMFAFAVWDNEKSELFVARDRLGIKPLYYTHKGTSLAFSSELRALLSSGIPSKKISESALVDYVSYQTVHAPDTILEEVKILMPGHYMVLKKGQLRFFKWWDPKEYIKTTREDEDPEIIKREIKNLFFSSVEKRLVADVPFGAFLSGGIDSSAIVGAMAEVSASGVETFNVAFDDSEFSESVYARQIAARFNTRHHEIKLSPEHFLKSLPDALAAMDHPGGDGPNTYVVSKATREAGITMALSGLGGDELFCGYDIFKRSYSLEKKWWLNLAPQFVRKAGGELYKLKNRTVGGAKIAEVLSMPSISFEYSYPVSRKVLDDELIKELCKMTDLPAGAVQRIVREQGIKTDTHRLSKYSLAEMETYMQNVLLRDADQMSMAVALELRVPFLDYRLVQYVLSVPDIYKFPHTPKKLLTDSLAGLLPAEIINRPKMGFTFPWANWMKGELRTFCEEQLHLLCRRNEINGTLVMNLWKRFLSGDKKITWSRIWHLVVLGFWLRHNGIEG